MPINFPATVDTDAVLGVAVNSLATTLDGALAADTNGNNGSATEITVVSTTNFPTAGIFCVETEAIRYTGKTATKFTGITRGVDGTTAAAHVNGSAVELKIVAEHHNYVKDAVIAIETNILANHDRYGWVVLQSAAGARVSNTSFTVTGDVTALIQVGDKIKLTDTTTKYYYVVAAPSYSAGTGLTTITVNGGTDYIVVGNPSAIYYSKLENPQGFPCYFNFADTNLIFGSGSAGTYAQTIYHSFFTVIGKTFTYQVGIKCTNVGSWSGDVLIKLPIATTMTSNGSTGVGNLILRASSSVASTILGFSCGNNAGSNVKFLKQTDTAVVAWGDVTAGFYIYGSITMLY